jgi:hypothetical protein
VTGSGLRVYAVEWGNEFPAEIDSLWTTREEAQKHADELNDGVPSHPRRIVVIDYTGGKRTVRKWITAPNCTSKLTPRTTT